LSLRACSFGNTAKKKKETESREKAAITKMLSVDVEVNGYGYYW